MTKDPLPASARVVHFSSTHLATHQLFQPINMAISQHFDSGYDSHGNPELESSEARPVKKRKQDDVRKEDAAFVRRHPLGVRPSGNALTSTVNLKYSAGMLALLPDELLATLLEILEPQDLLRIGGTCRALHAFTRNEELWRTLFVE